LGEERSEIDPRVQRLLAAIWPAEMDGNVGDTKTKELTKRFAGLPGDEKVALPKEHVGTVLEELVLV